MKETINLENGKYTISHEDGLNFNCRRHGNEWRDLTGDSLMFAMFNEMMDLYDANVTLVEKLEECGIDIEEIMNEN